MESRGYTHIRERLLAQACTGTQVQGWHTLLFSRIRLSRAPDYVTAAKMRKIGPETSVAIKELWMSFIELPPCQENPVDHRLKLMLQAEAAAQAPHLAAAIPVNDAVPAAIAACRSLAFDCSACACRCCWCSHMAELPYHRVCAGTILGMQHMCRQRIFASEALLACCLCRSCVCFQASNSSGVSFCTGIPGMLVTQ